MRIHKKYKNHPALHQAPISEPALITPPRESESVLQWIESSGRFKSHESDKYLSDKPTNEIEELLDQEEELDEE
ncbi:Protein of unknown function (DUF3134) [Rivularia sp. PCC 7116]|uniref:DUF3134 family protein n=1 Tax=Rivularia sp. PCC 7116 TaxID=373994 RepID=UPI00029F37FF|nr:DUF3134 family protein [Rivularia sp. PCC 7116]AFY57482.1 Protein of unknown function (DUF3134) [Rivularia sp. PCC 7116]